MHNHSAKKSTLYQPTAGPPKEETVRYRFHSHRVHGEGEQTETPAFAVQVGPGRIRKLSQSVNPPSAERKMPELETVLHHPQTSKATFLYPVVRLCGARIWGLEWTDRHEQNGRKRPIHVVVLATKRFSTRQYHGVRGKPILSRKYVCCFILLLTIIIIIIIKSVAIRPEWQTHLV